MRRALPWLALAARLYLGGIFLAAAVHKIADPASFATDVAVYGIVPREGLHLVALVLPWLEALAGALLVVGWRVAGAALAVAGMLAVFVGALAWALAHGVDAGCGCFASSGDHPIGAGTLLRDLAWLALAVAVLVVDRRPIGVDGWLARRARPRR